MITLYAVYGKSAEWADGQGVKGYATTEPEARSMLDAEREDDARWVDDYRAEAEPGQEDDYPWPYGPAYDHLYAVAPITVGPEVPPFDGQVWPDVSVPAAVYAEGPQAVADYLNEGD